MWQVIAIGSWPTRFFISDAANYYLGKFGDILPRSEVNNLPRELQIKLIDYYNLHELIATFYKYFPNETLNWPANISLSIKANLNFKYQCFKST